MTHTHGNIPHALEIHPVPLPHFSGLAHMFEVHQAKLAVKHQTDVKPGATLRFPERTVP